MVSIDSLSLSLSLSLRHVQSAFFSFSRQISISDCLTKFIPDNLTPKRSLKNHFPSLKNLLSADQLRISKLTVLAGTRQVPKRQTQSSLPNEKPSSFMARSLVFILASGQLKHVLVCDGLEFELGKKQLDEFGFQGLLPV